MTPAMGLNEPAVPSASDAAAANGLDDVRVVGEQGHLQDTPGNDEEEDRVPGPGEPDKDSENVFGRSAVDDDDPFDDSDSVDGDDDGGFVPRGEPRVRTGAAPRQQKFSPTKAEKNSGNEAEGEKQKDAQKHAKNVKTAK
ncbi:hypothetical protein V8D89_009772 [Ganoderma adspersum]